MKPVSTKLAVHAALAAATAERPPDGVKIKRLRSLSLREQRMLLRQLAENCPNRVSELALRCGISVRQIERYIKKLFGCSAKQFLTSRKMLVAGQMLLRRGKVKMIAEVGGFGRQADFGRKFKAAYGVTPSKFRTSAAAKSLKQCLDI